VKKSTPKTETCEDKKYKKVLSPYFIEKYKEIDKTDEKKK